MSYEDGRLTGLFRSHASVFEHRRYQEKSDILNAERVRSTSIVYLSRDCRCIACNQLRNASCRFANERNVSFHFALLLTRTNQRDTCKRATIGCDGSGYPNSSLVHLTFSYNESSPTKSLYMRSKGIPIRHPQHLSNCLLVGKVDRFQCTGRELG